MRRTVIGLIVIAVVAIVGISLFREGEPQSGGSLKFGVANEPYPPFTSPDASGKWIGFEVDLMEALCAEMKTKCEIAPVAWEGIIPALLDKKIDVIFSSMSITDERRKQIDFSNKYYDTPAVFVAPKSSNIQVSREGLQGKVIGVQTSTTHANYAQKYYGDVAQIKIYDTQDNANADALAGRVDVLLADSIVLVDWLKSGGADFEVKLQAPSDPIFGEGIGAGLRKEDAALKEKINTAIHAVRASGKYDEIAKKYFDFDVYGR